MPIRATIRRHGRPPPALAGAPVRGLLGRAARPSAAGARRRRRPRRAAGGAGGGANGTTIDFVTTPEGAAFKIENPNEPPKVKQMAPRALADRLKDAAKPIPFTVSRAEPNLSKKVVVAPRGKLPRDAAIEFRVPSEFTGQEGPLPVEKPLVVAYRTYGALRVQRFDCDKETPHGYCAPGGALGLSLQRRQEP